MLSAVSIAIAVLAGRGGPGQVARFSDAPESRRDEIHEIVASIDLLP